MLTAMNDAGLKAQDLDIVLLVGGSTRIPCVQQLVSDVLETTPQSLVDPDLTVARGAAIQAAIIEGTLEAASDLVLTDVCPYTLGTAVLVEGIFGYTEVIDPLIPRNKPIPVDVTKQYSPAYDYQTQVKVRAYQGESLDPESNELLGDVLLDGIPPARVGKQPVEITFSYDMNGILQVKGRVVSTGKEVSCEINTTGVTPLPELDLTKWEQAEGAKPLRPVLRKAEKLAASHEEFAGDIQMRVRKIKEALLTGKREHAEALSEQLKTLFEFIEDPEAFRAKLEELSELEAVPANEEDNQTV